MPCWHMDMHVGMMAAGFSLHISGVGTVVAMAAARFNTPPPLPPKKQNKGNKTIT